MEAVMSTGKCINTLFYIHDPMCSWCYAFKSVLQQLRQQLPEDIEFITVLGGLAPDTDEPMPFELQQQLQATWQRIEQKVPAVHFNYDFWENCNPRRSTFPACRAVIAAHSFDNTIKEHYYEELMLEAIQHAYYQHAQNPSDNSTLIKLSKKIGLDEKSFQAALYSEQIQLELDRQIALSRQLKAYSYPSFVLKTGEGFRPIGIDYLSPEPILESINLLLESE